MDVAYPNAFLQELLSPERRMQNFQNPKIKKGAEKQLQLAPFCTDPVVGTYRIFSWKLGFDPDVQVMVMEDGYFPGKSAMFHSHDFFEIVYVYSGHCQTQVSGQTVELCSGDICLYNLYAIHQVQFLKPGDGIFNILIRRDLFRRLLLELLAENDLVSSFFLHILYDRESPDSCIYLRPDARYRCVQLAQQIIETFYHNPPMRQLTLKSQMLLLLMEIARQYRENQLAESARSAAGLDIEAVITYISTHYLEASQEATARHFGYSARSLTRLLKKYTGYGFREIVQDVRFSNARALLQEGHLSVDEVALAVGYRDRSNFENAFKKYCHITPSAYRRQFGAK